MRHCLSSSRWSTTQQNKIVRIKTRRICCHTAKAICYDIDVFNPLTVRGKEVEREINVKDIYGSFTESVVNNKITEMTESVFVHPIIIINHVKTTGNPSSLGTCNMTLRDSVIIRVCMAI